MWIVCLAANSNEMPNLIFSKITKKKKKNQNIRLLQLWLAGLISYIVNIHLFLPKLLSEIISAKLSS